MAKKNLIPMDDDYEIDVSPVAGSSSKLPGDISGGLSPILDYMEIPCEMLVEYKEGNSRFFRPWPEDRFETLVDSIREHGVIEAIIVRPYGTNGQYEVLAGWHRWKASEAAGLATVPARIMRECNDKTARFIFTVTNTLRRDNTIRDRINGWWLYFETVNSGDASVNVNELIESGIVSPDLSRVSRTSYRYARMHSLLDEYIDLIEEKKLNVNAGEHIAGISKERQTELLKYKDRIRTESNADALEKLANGRIPGMSWSEDNIRRILQLDRSDETPVVPSLSYAAKSAKGVIKSRLRREYYSEAKEIFDEAMTLYFKKHPEREVQRPPK